MHAERRRVPDDLVAWRQVRRFDIMPTRGCFIPEVLDDYRKIVMRLSQGWLGLDGGFLLGLRGFPLACREQSIPFLHRRDHRG